MNFLLPTSLKPGLILVLFACVLTFVGLNRVDLRESTEPREAGVAADMLQSEQFLMPTLNGRAFLEKPPLSYWLQAASVRVFGYEPFAVRLPSALAGIATAVLLAGFFGPTQRRAGFLAGILVITMASFWSYARTAGQDALLALGIALALLSFFRAREGTARRGWIAFSAGIALATMTKGVVGLAVPGVVIFAFLLVESVCFDGRLVLRNWLTPAAYTLLGLLPILVWLYLLFDATGMEAVKEVIWNNSVGRFEGEYTGGAHAEPFYFYLRKLPETFQPWSLLLYVAVWQSAKQLTRDRQGLFFFCWLVAPYVLLSLSAGKRPSYLLMLYPAAAALLARYIIAVVDEYQANPCARVAKTARWLAALQAVFLSAAAAWVVFRLLTLKLLLVGAMSFLLIVPVWVVLWRSLPKLRLFEFTAAGAGVLLLTYLCYFTIVVPQDDEKQSIRTVIEALAPFVAAGRPVALYQPSERLEGAASFYLQRRVRRIDSEDDLRKAVADHPQTVVLVDEAGSVDRTRYRDLGRQAYGKLGYRYVSGE